MNQGCKKFIKKFCAKNVNFTVLYQKRFGSNHLHPWSKCTDPMKIVKFRSSPFRGKKAFENRTRFSGSNPCLKLALQFFVDFRGMHCRIVTAMHPREGSHVTPLGNSTLLEKNFSKKPHRFAYFRKCFNRDFSRVSCLDMPCIRVGCRESS